MAARRRRNTEAVAEPPRGRAVLEFRRVFGFEAGELASWSRFVRLLFRPADPASLGVVRALFGLLMIVDIVEERGLGEADVRWGDPMQCYFPLFDFLRPPPLPWMCILYLIMWTGAAGIALGLRFRTSCAMFAVPFWFVLLLDKSRWNNHSYLFGIVAILLSRSSAHHYFSLDALRSGWRNRPVPAWNYAALRFQFFLLYFLAGVKKLDHDWIDGYSMAHLNNHWVFDPFKLVLSPEQVDYWVVHMTGFLLDLTVGFWMFLDATRPVAFVFCAMFHIMNSRLFMIGMFPYVCLVTMPLFCHNDWPRNLVRFVCFWKSDDQKGKPISAPWIQPESHLEEIRDAGCLEYFDRDRPDRKARDGRSVSVPVAPRLRWHHYLTGTMLLSHAGLQLFLPYSHSITEGYNTWTNGLYGYSWDMMVHSWDTILVVVKVVERDSGREHFLDPDAWVHSDRWAKHADMAKQYSVCVEHNLHSLRVPGARDKGAVLRSDNVSIHVDVWCSLNGRFQQRIFDPRVDLLTAPWSPFRPVPWVMPLLTELSSMRERIKRLEAEVHAWSNHSDALFVADFPGLYLENYITGKLDNVTLTVLAGNVVLELNPTLADATPAHHVPRRNTTLAAGESTRVPTRVFHRVHTVSDRPACYMYTYVNLKRQREERARPSEMALGTAGASRGPAGDQQDGVGTGAEPVGAVHKLVAAIRLRAKLFKRSIAFVSNAVLNILHSVPMLKRVRVPFQF